MNLAIYGAQGYALGVYEALKTLYPKRTVSFFIVSEMGINAPVLGNIPVREISEVSSKMSDDEKEDLEVIIAVPENIQSEIAETLERSGFRNYVRMDSKRWDELMKLFHIKTGRFLPLTALPVGCHDSLDGIYLAKHHKDKPLNDPPLLKDYIRPIQVGAVNADKRIADLSDDTGENISERNPNYSELSGLYWLWRNRLSAPEKTGDAGNGYVGFMQYRRILDLSEDDLLRLEDNGVDVVLPYPLPYEPDINAHHERYLKEADWNALLTALKELQPEYAAFFPKVLEQRYLFNYNVILAKRQVLSDYCGWLFPVLMRTEELSVPKGSERADRYIGYMGETLETLYFMKNSGNLNIVYAGCRMYV